MGGLLGPDDPCAKGPIPYCLDEVSKGVSARVRLEKLRDEIVKLGPNCHDLEKVFDAHLLSYFYPDDDKRSAITEHLKKNWFDENSSEAYFPNQRVAAIYASGVLKALELSLNAQDPVPLNAWWLVDSGLTTVKMLTFAELDGNGVTVGGRVTLLIETPKPQGARGGRVILGNLAHAWVSEQRPAGVVTREIK
jgi:hypothetical protein